MTPSPACEAFIKRYEKLRLDAFLPTQDDKPTIGWGATGPEIRLGMHWTKAQADARFTADLARFSAGVMAELKGAPTTQSQFDAMVSLAYNIGLAGFATSSVLTNHKARHLQTAALAFSLWNKQRDRSTGQLVVVDGLTTRRADEAAMYRGERVN